MILKRVLKLLFSHKNTEKELFDNRLDSKFTIEFIGPSGIGKSTLFKEYFSKTDFNFYTQNDIYKIKSRLDEQNILSNIYKELLFKKHSNLLDRAYNAYVSTELLNYFTKIVSEDIVIQNASKDFGFIIEEGIVHNFSMELFQLSNENLSLLLKNRIIIYIRPENPNLIVQRIKKRASEGGHVVIHHNNKTDEELLNIAKQSIVHFDKLINRIKELNIPCIQIIAEENNGSDKLKSFFKDTKYQLIRENNLYKL